MLVKQRTAELSAEIQKLHKELEEYKRAEQNLYLLSSAVDQSSEGMAVSDLEGHLRFVNPAFAQMHGYSSEELLGKHLSIFHTSKQMPEVEKANQAIQEIGEYAGEIWHTRRDGTEFPALMHNALVRDSSGQPVGMVASLLDITERKQSEQSLREERNYSDKTINSLPGIFYMLDSQGAFLRWNKNLEEVTGYSEAEVQRMRALEFFVESDRKLVAQRIQEVFEKGYATVEATVQSKNGQHIPYYLTGSRALIGGQAFLIGMALDITERKQVEGALLESKQMLQLVMDNIPQFIFWKDRHSVYLGCNSNFARVAGISDPADIVGKTDYDLAWQKEEADFFRECDQRVMEGNRPDYHIIEPQLLADGKHAWLDTNKIPLRDLSGKVVGILGTYEDITERKEIEKRKSELEARIQRGQKLESLGILAGGVAHDFNNLLVGILGNAGLALMDLPPDSPARMSIEYIETAAQRAAELAREMLAFSGKRKFVVQPLDLSKLVEEMAHLLKTYISQKVVLKFHMDANLPPIPGDATQIRQVVMNMIANASDAIGDNQGVITVSTGMLEANLDYLSEMYLHEDLPEGPYAYIEVSDTGCGIDSKILANIFDPTATTKSAGQGLGLASVLGIVRSHHGAVKVDTIKDNGTTFRILMPWKPQLEETTHPSTAKVPADWCGQGTVLVVDDEETVLTLAQMSLKKFGYTAIVVNNGPEAIEIFREKQQEIIAVVLDQTMPQMDGIEVGRILKEISPSVPILLSTGYCEQDLNIESSELELAGYIHKPYKPLGLVDAIRQATENQAD